MGLFKKKLIVKNLSVKDRLINFFSVVLEVIDIVNFNEKEITVKVRSTGQLTPKIITFQKNQSGEIVLIGYKKHISLCQSRKKTDYFKKNWEKI